MKKYILLIIISTILTSCHSVKKSFESRNYDTVIDLFTKKKKVTDEEISMFEKSYKAALERDKEKIVQLKAINNGDRWEQIFDLYTKINTRQNSVMRVIPVFYSNGNKADIEIFNLSAALEESRQNAAQSYYDQGLKLLNTNNKTSIRQSLDYFNASKKFYINYKDVNELMQQALSKGKNYVLLLVEKNPSLLLPPSFEQSILDNVKLTQNEQWVNIDYRRKDNINYDYVVKLNLYDIVVSPDVIKETQNTEEKLVEDGWQYVLDPRGNVKKDSLGNDIKIPKYTKISCLVKETRMTKSAQVFGDVTIYEAQTKDFIKNQKCIGNAAFDYSYIQLFGDRNAVSEATLKKLGNAPMLFPTTFEMVERSKNELIKCYQDFVIANYNMFQYVK
ncbi:MAG TPA: hypothetical protein PK431_10890 [Chitinophagales bacterium]|nr:hypothetical protein [Chitinophagales bacterium]